MPPRRLEAEIDRLYQLPPDAFTSARNALAKTAGTDAAMVRGLAKPPLAAWAVNQLYWQQRPVYDAVVTAAKEMREAHAAVLSGRSADLRAAGKAHDAAVEGAVKAALSLLEGGEHKATDATRQAVTTTVRALPGDDPPGRLTTVLQPGGFEMLAGLSIGGRSAAAPPHPPPPRERRGAPPVEHPRRGGGRHAKTAPVTAAARDRDRKREAQAKAAAREAAAAAGRAVREAEHTARREEFEAARTARDAERAERRLAQARDALAEATREVEEAGAAAAEALRLKEEAERRAAAAAAALTAARSRVSRS